MINPLPYIALGLAVFVGFFYWMIAEDNARVRVYIDDCGKQSGRVVKMYTHRDLGNWMQCVRGLEVVMLPQDK